jgi:hypothetical protein
LFFSLSLSLVRIHAGTTPLSRHELLHGSSDLITLLCTIHDASLHGLQEISDPLLFPSEQHDSDQATKR